MKKEQAVEGAGQFRAKQEVSGIKVRGKISPAIKQVYDQFKNCQENRAICHKCTEIKKKNPRIKLGDKTNSE